jgi:hypothetical protein
MSPIGTVRGIFVSMLERYRLPDVRAFWKSNPVPENEHFLPELEGYRYLWERKGLLPLYYLEQINAALVEFLAHRKESSEGFYNERHFRFEQGGMWAAPESLAWLKDFIPTLYTRPDPKLIIANMLCQWAKKALPGSDCQLPYCDQGEDWVEAVLALAPDASFRFRVPYVFSRSTMYGMNIFPRFMGFSAYEKTGLLADCLHPGEIVKDIPWKVEDGVFFLDGTRYGRVVPFMEWDGVCAWKFQGLTVPNRPSILMERSYVSPDTGWTALMEGTIYDAPLFAARLGFPRQKTPLGNSIPKDFLSNILGGMTLEESEEWRKIEATYRGLEREVEAALKDLQRAAGEVLAFEYRANTQALILNGKVVICGVPAKIFRRIVLASQGGQSTFNFRAFKYDPEIFPDSKRSSFETRWNRLREKLSQEAPQIHLDKSRKGEFVFSSDRPLEFQELL